MITYTLAQAVEWCHQNEIFIGDEHINDYYKIIFIEHKGRKKYGQKAYHYIDDFYKIRDIFEDLYCKIYEKHLLKDTNNKLLQ